MAILITNASIGNVTLDASVNEVHSAEVEVTDHPVEKGANVSDHKRSKPETIQIEGVISNTPIPKPDDQLTTRQTGSISFSSRGEMDVSLVTNAWDALRKIKDGDELVQVITSLRIYDNMAITSLSAPRDARTGQVLRFTAQLKQIKIVNSQTVAVSDTKKNVSLGKKAATPTPAAEANKTTLKQLADTGTGDSVLKFFGLRAQ